ncbi:glycosyltransferase family 1 protein [Trametes coccinea BRFM310]|uniref:Glycosyltransferase family 1 protein n=1 Tax=Trametes coccinea (strain BRFM310) TaxID=1353009 RepID=A0A1Y2IS12_TRAC3|nr:glycosyltransferase family 1 protein [Trametes coccinea BRFM310]
MTTRNEKHVVALTYQAWGHARPLIQLSARLVKMSPLQITFFTTDAYVDRILDELTNSFERGEEVYADRVRVLSLGNDPGFTTEVVDEGFELACEKLVAGEELRCAKTGRVFAALPPPQAAIIDFFAVKPIAAIKQSSGNSAKVYAWFSGMTTAAFMVVAPEKYGGPGNIRIKAEEMADKTGKSFEDAVVDLLFTPKGKVHNFPGLPPMIDYELYPQETPISANFVSQTFGRMYEALETCDGVFLNSPASYELEALEAARAWFGETGRSAYVCGPLVPHGSCPGCNDSKTTKKGTKIIDFLDTILKASGERSLLYISFGSMYWPTKSPEKLWAFLDVAMALDIPFLLSHASPRAGALPDEIVDKVGAYGKGMLSPWTPQQTVLEHKATGWFVTHCGQNSVIESISAGIPMIAWPFNADQPLNAVRISEVLEVGYELLEVRTGHGLHPLHRNGRKPVGTIDAVKAEAKDVLTKAFGDDGAQKREKLLTLTRAFEQEWEEGGASWEDVHAFLDSL